METSSIEKVLQLYEDTADSYDETMDTEIDLPVYSDTLYRLAERIAGIEGPVIDTSCGSGHMLYRYHERYDPKRSLIAIDLSPSMVAIASARLGSSVKIFTADMRDLSMIVSQSSAAVLSFFAIHHIDPDDALVAFREWYRILCPNGQLVLAGWEGNGPIDYGDETDVVALRYTQDEIAKWALETGFSINRCVVEPIEEMEMNAVYLEATKE